MQDNRKPRIMLVFGTRPDAIKMCSLVNELKRRPRLDIKVVVSGQHRDMLDGVLKLFGVVPDYDLSVMKESQTLSDITESILASLTPLLCRLEPDLVLLHGDTTTALAAALACFYQKIPVGHVEAGLRTYNLASPHPEEFNRRAVGIISDWHFAPTAAAGANLIREGIDPARVFVTGNTVIDALKTTVTKDYTQPLLEGWQGRIILMTAHRRESQGEIMRGIFRAVRRAVSERSDVRLIYPMHRSPAVRDVALAELSGCPGIILCEPLGLFDFHNIMARSTLVLTDSGGIQEEAPSLGVPVLVLRETTERPEGLAAGVLRLGGTDEDGVYSHITDLLDNPGELARMRCAVNPYGDGNACRRIADIIEGVIFADNKNRPSV